MKLRKIAKDNDYEEIELTTPKTKPSEVLDSELLGEIDVGDITDPAYELLEGYDGVIQL